MNLYNWQQPDWPHFRYQLEGVQDILMSFAEKMGNTNGAFNALPDAMQLETAVHFMVDEAIKTSEIEGEYLNRQDIFSSIRNNLGLNHPPEKVTDNRAPGVAELMITVRRTYEEPLTVDMLWAWHRMLLVSPTPSKSILIGEWRTHTEPMQVISGYHGKWTVHFEAPPSDKVPNEMQAFIKWFNQTAPGQPQEIKLAPVRAAIAHLYFETIHPFEDGNGRIGRALAEKALSQSLHRPALLSLSKTIEANKKAYYAALKAAQRSNEITEWIHYFLATLLDAQQEAEQQVEFIIQKAKFFDRFKEEMNTRQLKVVNRMLKEGPEGFVGGMSPKKYCAITGTSKATATRDLQELLEKGILKQIGSGRSTHYEIHLP